jgi:hypothetical protein
MARMSFVVRKDCFGEGSAAADAKRRPSFQTKSPRRSLPDPCYQCNPWFSESVVTAAEPLTPSAGYEL